MCVCMCLCVTQVFGGDSDEDDDQDVSGSGKAGERDEEFDDFIVDDFGRPIRRRKEDGTFTEP